MITVFSSFPALHASQSWYLWNKHVCDDLELTGEALSFLTGVGFFVYLFLGNGQSVWEDSSWVVLQAPPSSLHIQKWFQNGALFRRWLMPWCRPGWSLHRLMLLPPWGLTLGVFWLQCILQLGSKLGSHIHVDFQLCFGAFAVFVTHQPFLLLLNRRCWKEFITKPK